MSSLSINDRRWCSECNVYIYPNLREPPSHSRHKRGVGLNSTSHHCNICNTTIYDGMSLPSTHPHYRHMTQDAQIFQKRQQEQMIKAEQEDDHGMKIIDKGRYVATSGIIPGE